MSVNEQMIGTLPLLSHMKTQSISPENYTGEKGKGGCVSWRKGLRAMLHEI